MNENVRELRVLSEGGCEQYIEMSVTLSDEECELPRKDPNCRRKFKAYVGDRPFVSLKGTMTARWKSAADREKCKVERLRNRRWADVEKYAAQMKDGEAFPPGMFIHPFFTGRSDGLLVPIDGARRLMAHLEVGHTEMVVAVICPTSA